MGSGALAFNGGGQSTIIGVPLYVVRLVNMATVAGTDYFLGGRWSRVRVRWVGVLYTMIEGVIADS